MEKLTNVPETTEEYNGVCMEIAGIETCGLGYQAPEIPNQNDTSEE